MATRQNKHPLPSGPVWPGSEEWRNFPLVLAEDNPLLIKRHISGRGKLLIGVRVRIAPRRRWRGATRTQSILGSRRRGGGQRIPKMQNACNLNVRTSVNVKWMINIGCNHTFHPPSHESESSFPLPATRQRPEVPMHRGRSSIQ